MKPAPLARSAERRQLKLLSMAENAMRAYHVVLRTKGRTAKRTPEALYGFRAQDVVEMYSQKKGVGPGLWYRLKDGRVIDAFGKGSSRARSWYVVMPMPRFLIKQRIRSSS